MRQRNGKSSEIDGQALIFYDSSNDQYRNYHIHHQIQEEFSLVSMFSESILFILIFVAKKVGRHSVGPLRFSNGSLTDNLELISTLDAEASMGHDGFHPKLLSLYQALHMLFI